MDLKLYILDMGWQGAQIVFAKNKQDAEIMMKLNPPAWSTNVDYTGIHEYEIKEGFVDYTIGD